MKSQWHDLALPAARIGEYAIEHVEAPAGHVFNLSTARTAMIGGQPHLTVSFDEPSRWHRLVGPTGVWMSDLPIEQQQHDTLLKPIRGARTVLVGGLGLGYAVTQLARRKKLRKILVVEKQREVIDLVWPHLLASDPVAKSKVTVINECLFDTLRSAKHLGWQYDWGFFDIWQQDSESTFFDVVVPLRELAVGVIEDHRLLCWNEDVMRGQLRIGLYGRIGRAAGEPGVLDQLATETENKWLRWSQPFFAWVRERHPPIQVQNEVGAAYVDTYGRPTHAEAWRRWQEDTTIHTKGDQL